MTAGEPRRRWLFHAHNRLAEPALAEVLEACRGRDGIEAAFTREHAGGDLPPSLAAREVPLEGAAAGRWDAVFAADNRKGERVPPGYRVRVPHGAAFGFHGYGVVSLARCDLFVATSEAHRDFLERHRVLADASSEIVVGGHPRLDRLRRVRPGRDETVAALGLDPGRPTVVVSSHWTPEGNLRRFGAALPRAILAALPGANVLQAGHPNVWSRVRYDIADPRAGLATRLVKKIRREVRPFDYEALFRALAELEAESQRFRVVGPDRSFEAIAAADVLVADLSSATAEFTLFDRPIVLSLPPGFRPWDPAVVAAYRAASHPCDGPRDVGAALRAALSAPDARRAGRAALRALCLAHVGRSGERIVGLVLART